jgi:uncharacterized protein (DUF934 family)
MMQEIIKDKAIVQDDWTVLRLAENETPDAVDVPAGKVIVPLKVWLLQRNVLEKRTDIGVWFSSDEQAKDLEGDIARFSLLAVDFPKFSDGRGYSIAYNLRSRFGFSGELRAIGDVLRDQLFYMQRVGFNAFAVRADKNIHDAIKGLTDFSEKYQTSWDEKIPCSVALNVRSCQMSDFEARLAATKATLEEIAAEFTPAVFASSLAAEDMVLTDLILRNKLNIGIFSLETGRLHAETLGMLDAVKNTYGTAITLFKPEAAAVDAYVQQHGLNAFYDSVEMRKECCRIRKVEPLNRALAGKKPG